MKKTFIRPNFTLCNKKRGNKKISPAITNLANQLYTLITSQEIFFEWTL